MCVLHVKVGGHQLESDELVRSSKKRVPQNLQVKETEKGWGSK